MLNIHVTITKQTDDLVIFWKFTSLTILVLHPDVGEIGGLATGDESIFLNLVLTALILLLFDYMTAVVVVVVRFGRGKHGSSFIYPLFVPMTDTKGLNSVTKTRALDH